MKYRDQKNPTNTGSYTGYFEGGIRGITLKITLNTGRGAEMLLSKDEMQGQEKIQNTEPYTGYFRREIQGNAM